MTRRQTLLYQADYRKEAAAPPPTEVKKEGQERLPSGQSLFFAALNRERRDMMGLPQSKGPPKKRDGTTNANDRAKNKRKMPAPPGEKATPSTVVNKTPPHSISTTSSARHLGKTLQQPYTGQESGRARPIVVGGTESHPALILIL